MKKGYVAAIILIVIPLFCLVFYYNLKMGCEDILQIVKNIEFEEENAAGEFQKAEKKWNKLKNTLAYFSNHSEIEETNRLFIKGKEGLRMKNKYMFEENRKLLESVLEHMYTSEKLLLYNVF